MDLNQVVENSVTYNGSNSNFTRIAEKMRQAGLDFLEEVRPKTCCYRKVLAIRQPLKIGKLPTGCGCLFGHSQKS